MTSKGSKPSLAGSASGAHDLDLHGVRRELALLNRSPKVALRVIWVHTRHLDRVGPGKHLLAGVVKTVILDGDQATVLVHPLKGVASVTMRSTPAIGGSMVGEEHYPSMLGLWDIGQEVEQRVIVKQEVLRIALLGPDYVGALDRIAIEENGPVQTDDIVITVLGVVLDGEASRVAT